MLDVVTTGGSLYRRVCVLGCVVQEGSWVMTETLSKGTHHMTPSYFLCRGFEWPWTQHAIELYFSHTLSYLLFPSDFNSSHLSNYPNNGFKIIARSGRP